MLRQDQKGFHIVYLGLVVVVITILGLVGWRVASNPKVRQKISDTTASVTKSSSACPDPLLQAPADISRVTAVLYPGQYRGGNYKAHGGLIFGNAPDNNIVVKAPMNSTLVDGARYIEQGETQVLLDFKSDCGVTYRFDHLLTLAPKFQAAVDKLPAPQPENSETHNLEALKVATGETVATAVGFPKMHNVSFDFGVYDNRQANTASKEASYIATHKNDPGWDKDSHAVCWLNYLPASDSTTLKALPGGDQVSGKNSDFCK